MGAGQSYQWAVSHPQMVPQDPAVLRSAKTGEHNIVFLEGVEAALRADGAFQEGWYENHRPGPARRGTGVPAGGSRRPSTGGRYHTEMGYSSLEDFLVSFWEASSWPRTPTTC